MKNKILIILLCVFTIMHSCKKDEGGTDDFIPVDVRDRAEQQIIDNDSLLGYFETHYYNSVELSNMVNPTMSDIIITALEEGETVPTDHTLLIDDVITKTTVFQEADYEYYILSINQGGGEVSPHFCDNVRVNYFGTLLDDDPIPFDSTVNPITTDLLNLVRGWQLVLPDFNVAESSVVLDDNTVQYNDFGLGVMFLPSGLGFYANAAGDIPLYSPLIFKFELLESSILDHDNDNIASFLEDLNGDFLLDEDTDEDIVPNFIDTDDDGDDVRTEDELIPQQYVINSGDPDPVFGPNEFEISRIEEGGEITINTLTIADSNGDGVFDYLDDTISINYNDDN